MSLLIRRFATRDPDGPGGTPPYPIREEATWEQVADDAGGVPIAGQAGFWRLSMVSSPLAVLPPSTPPTFDSFGNMTSPGSGPDFAEFDLYAAPIKPGLTVLANEAAYFAAYNTYVDAVEPGTPHLPYTP